MTRCNLNDASLNWRQLKEKQRAAGVINGPEVETFLEGEQVETTTAAAELFWYTAPGNL